MKNPKYIIKENFRSLMNVMPKDVQKIIKEYIDMVKDKNSTKKMKLRNKIEFDCPKCNLHAVIPLDKLLNMIRTAVANYMGSEGCGCCSDRDVHKKHKNRLAKLLDFPKYKDGSGYDFHNFRSKK